MTVGTHLLGTNRDFTLLWIGQAVSSLGGFATLIAYPLLVLAISHSPSESGLVMSLMVTAQLLISLPGGVLVDRMDKRRLMLLCDLGRTAATTLLAIAIAGGRVGIGLIALVAVVNGLLGSIFGTAEGPAVRHVVGAEQLPLALARNEARGAAAALIGPVLGGALFAVGPVWPFAVDAASFAFSFLCITLIRASMPSCLTTPDRAGYRDLLDGLRWLWRRPFLRVSLILIAGLNFASNALFLVVVVASRERGDPAATTSLLLTMGAIGSLVGALLAPRLVALLTVRTILIANRAVWAFLIATMLLTHNTYVIGALLAVMYLLGPTGGTAVVSRQMALTPEDMQGRASSARGFLAGISAPIGIALIGIVLDNLGRERSIILLAAWMGLMTVIAWRSRAIRVDASRPAIDPSTVAA